MIIQIEQSSLCIAKLSIYDVMEQSAKPELNPMSHIVVTSNSTQCCLVTAGFIHGPGNSKCYCLPSSVDINCWSQCFLGCQVAYNIIIYVWKQVQLEMCTIHGTMNEFICIRVRGGRDIVWHITTAALELCNSYPPSTTGKLKW